jgi:hypothetical protein
VKPQPPALALGEIVLDPHSERCTDPGETVDQDPNESSVAKPDKCVSWDAVKQLAGFLWREDRRFAPPDDVFG